MGFGRHPHDNMEIISIPLQGDLEHKDSMGNVAVIRQHDVQIMSAGTGIYHSEYNKNKNEKVNFLQIWVFPKIKNIEPRYEQHTFRPEDRQNKLQCVVSADRNSEGVRINQEAWLYLGNFTNGFSTAYKVHHSSHGVYVFVIRGSVTVDRQPLNTRDGMGVWDTDSVTLTATSDAEVLLMEVPMTSYMP
jgi:hypothetical protein